MAVRGSVLARRSSARRVPAGRQLPAGRHLVIVVLGIVAFAAVAGLVAMRMRQDQERVAHRHSVEAQVRDTRVVDDLRSQLSELVQVNPPSPNGAPAPTVINAALRPGLPVTVDDLLPEAAEFAITPYGRSGQFDVYVIDTDRFAERSVDHYGSWLSSTELIPIDPFAAERIPDLPRLTRGEVLVAFDADDDGGVNRVVVVGDDPILSNAAVFETDR